MKRFWQAANAVVVPGGWGIALDGKPVRTPERAALVVPELALAQAIAAEWQAQVPVVDPREMRLTGLANAAIDRVAPDRQAFADRLARFGESELLAYRAEHPAALVAHQAQQWDPWLAWAQLRYDVVFHQVAGIIHQPQPHATLVRIAAAYGAFDAFRLAALDPVVTITGSAVLGLAVAAGELDADAAYDIGHVDARWQEAQWGRDPLAEQAEAVRRADLAAAVGWLTLLAG